MKPVGTVFGSGKHQQWIHRLSRKQMEQQFCLQMRRDRKKLLLNNGR
jgi:hypothetical protein